jgi:hypothetical protein
MLVIVAGPRDATARALVARWTAHDARLLTCDDLSVAGWNYAPTDPAASTAVVGGCPVAVTDVVGVLTRLPGVSAEMLPHIDPADRSYVATEMHAFLVSWLNALPCPILNRPSPDCLVGPYWRREKWVRKAAHLGIPVVPVQRSTQASAISAPNLAATTYGVTVTVVGSHVVGDVAPALARHARELAVAAGVELLGVQFDGTTTGSRFLDATLWPDVADDAVAAALLDHFNKS